ncbi:MAG: zf-HC2 domain-containing protein, partial [Acetobacteraceae bacterium]
MKCDRAAADISLLLDRELGAAQRWRLRHHIAGCAACATELKEQQAMQA